MILELAIGDAYGAGFEYVRDRKFISSHNTLARYISHPKHKQKPGTYTDDTQMSIAIAELIVSDADWTKESVASHFLEAFHRDQRQGYAGGFYAFLRKTRTAADFLENIKPGSDKSGAAMRAGPIGVYPSIEEVTMRSALQASLTHDTPDGTNAAIAASLMTHYFLYDLGNKPDLPQFLNEHVVGSWDEPWIGEVGSRGWMSVRAALTSLVRNDSLSTILRSCIAWGGDTDTVATIALAAASCSSEIEADLPPILLNKLEKGTYGAPYLRSLDKRLTAFKKKAEKKG